ncbi:MAG: hypothetical protein V2I67_17705 [Thermoanaerobaculales bacterium]|nr:hypothetical protein [Thermoanaerobaculales bacterium]
MNQTTAPRIRPRVEVELDEDPDRVMERLRSRLHGCPRCTGVSVGRHAELFVPEDEQRVWSPWLSVTAEPAAEGGGSRVWGRFAPHPHVWTLYMFLAFGLGFALLVGATWGYAQWAMERTPWALLSLPMGLILGGALYLVSLVGQRLGAEQIERLEAALHELVERGTS